MSSKFKAITGTVATVALLSLCSPATAQSVFAQSDDADPEMRIERLENQLRQLTGQNEELQYRNRQLEERLRALEGGAQGAPGQAPNVAAMPPAQVGPGQVAPGYRQQPQQQAVQPNYEQPQSAASAPIVQEQPAPGAPGTRRRGDAFDPNQNPNAPGAPRALGGGPQPMPSGAPGGR
ncbi:tol-pal system protein, partial [Bradyrhizobium sp. CCBAU 11430]|nr:tol-pal system protein [Bradyrhizobium sp. CCBAU 65884]MDA9514629.1 tol-pal system protein [Bradyrhizobium sp. CCBAU 11430]